MMLMPTERIEQAILLIRGQKVMLDEDLAAIYGVELKVLNQAVKRKGNRFPRDFMFQLTHSEYDSLRSQFVTLKKGRGQHRKFLPFVFTEQGVSMLSSVLNSDRAVEVNIQIMRAFVNLREMIVSNKELAEKLNAMEQKYDDQFRVVFDAIRQLMSSDEVEKESIGFRVEEEVVGYS
jgi:hypothetical protein